MAYIAGVPCKIVNDSIKPRIDMAIKWMQADNGNWYPKDRSSSYDVYYGEFDVRGSRYWIDYLAYQLNGAREQIAVALDGEPIFGPGITADYATVVKFPKEARRGLNYWSLDGIVLAAISPGLGGSPNFNLLRLAKNEYESDHEYAIGKHRLMNANWAYLDRTGGDQTFKATFRNSDTHYGAVRRALISSVRGNVIAFPDIQGIISPFGPNGPSNGGNCRLKTLSNERRVSLDWEYDLEFVREFDVV